MNYQVEHDQPALEADPDYSLPFERYADEALDGFIYSMDVTFVSGDPEGDGLISQQAVVSLAFHNRLACFFSICEYE